jgi:phage terminase small subunit
MTDTTTPLSRRHERFVLKYLKDGNATQAYLRAGYSPRGAQPSASRLLRDPRIEAAVSAGRQRIAEALEPTVERIAQEYAKLAFASIDDFVSVDADGRLRIDLDKASQAQRAGLLELKITDHRKGEQAVVLKLGKLQALAALTRHVSLLVKKPAPGLTAEDRQRYEATIAGHESNWQHALDERRRLTRERDAAQIALAAAQAKLVALGSAAPKPPPPPPPPPPIEKHAMRDALEPASAPEQAPTAKPVVAPGMPTEPPPDCTPAHLNGKIFWNTDRSPPPGPSWNEIIRRAGHGGFPGW